MTDDPAFTRWFAQIRRHLDPARARAIERIARLPHGPELEVRLARKARRGWAEHDGGIIHMTADEVDDEAESEALDLVAYEGELLRRG